MDHQQITFLGALERFPIRIQVDSWFHDDSPRKDHQETNGIQKNGLSLSCPSYALDFHAMSSSECSAGS